MVYWVTRKALQLIPEGTEQVVLVGLRLLRDFAIKCPSFWVREGEVESSDKISGSRVSGRSICS